jgi:hypothetical protein
VDVEGLLEDVLVDDRPLLHGAGFDFLVDAVHVVFLAIDEESHPDAVPAGDVAGEGERAAAGHRKVRHPRRVDQVGRDPAGGRGAGDDQGGQLDVGTWSAGVALVVALCVDPVPAGFAALDDELGAVARGEHEVRALPGAGERDAVLADLMEIVTVHMQPERAMG